MLKPIPEPPSRGTRFGYALIFWWLTISGIYLTFRPELNPLDDNSLQGFQVVCIIALTVLCAVYSVIR